MVYENEIERRLRELEGELISRLTARGVIVEGTVMTPGPAPYRRLDCDGRAIAYVRARPRKGAVRIDVSGLWLAPEASRLRVPTAGGTASLFVRSGAELLEAAAYLEEVVLRTRKALDAERIRRKVRQPKSRSGRSATAAVLAPREMVACEGASGRAKAKVLEPAAVAESPRSDLAAIYTSYYE